MYNIDIHIHIPMYMDIDRQIEVGGGDCAATAATGGHCSEPENPHLV